MLVVTSKLCIEGIEYTRITRNNKAPESGGWSGCVVLACVGVCAVRPFPGESHSPLACTDLLIKTLHMHERLLMMMMRVLGHY